MVLSLPKLEIIEEFFTLGTGKFRCYFRDAVVRNFRGMPVNWQTLTMKFKLGGSWVILQGEPGLSKSVVSL